ncbi:MAG TPA: carboxypeptidase-like regulatory domain-containing protein, partial [Cyclobacteriaceae bacterium]|nr:carboxypeptidase-like regulatory domain-containing protein [Cyclobacteriaceae bacterium]
MVFMKQIALVLTFLVIVPSISHAQDKLTINGYVRDASNGEALIGATVYVKEINNGVVTNVYGFYSITLDPGAYTVNY